MADLQQLIKLSIGLSVMLLVVSLGLQAKISDATSFFRELSKPPYRFLRATLAMNIVVPAIAAVVVATVNLPQALNVAVIALAISPVPPILPGKQMKFGGNARYVFGLLVAISISSIILAPVTIEIISRIVERDVHIGVAEIAKLVAQTVLIPLTVGLLIRKFAPDFADRIGHPLTKIATLLLILGLLPVLYVFWPAVWALTGNGTVLIIAGMVIAAILAGHLIGGPEESDRTSLAITSAMRHPGIAMAIATTNYPEEKQLPAAILLYVIIAAICTTVYGKVRLRNA